MLGPEANHYILVSHAKNFLWRQGHLRDLIPLLGDGLLTIDGAFHRTHRKLMLPAFHRERIAAATAVMRDEVDAALGELQPDAVVDLYDWTRRVALRVAMRALFGVDPDTARAGGLNAAARVRVRAVVLRRATTCCRSCAGRTRRSGKLMRLAPAAGRAGLRRDRPPPRDAASAARTSCRCCWTHRRGRATRWSASTSATR